MIRHVTLITWKPGFALEELARWRAGLDELARIVPGVASLTHGPDAGLVVGQASADYVIIGDFETHEAMTAYYTHPDHDALKAISFPNSDRLVTADLEL